MNKLINIERLPQRYVVIDSRSGCVQIVHAHSQKEANAKALSQFRSIGGITANA